jgi:ABC-type cobalamin/Fe3+-siderophores transport system ATPase subunit
MDVAPSKNGAKTTLFRRLARIMQKQRGRVRVKDHSIDVLGSLLSMVTRGMII